MEKVSLADIACIGIFLFIQVHNVIFRCAIHALLVLISELLYYLKFYCSPK